MEYSSDRRELAKDLLVQILQLIDSILQRLAPVQVSIELTANDQGRLLLDAVCKQYLALGDAVKQLDKLTDFSLERHWPEQDWNGVMGFRDILAHQYFNVDPAQLLWITRHALPGL